MPADGEFARLERRAAQVDLGDGLIVRAAPHEVPVRNRVPTGQSPPFAMPPPTRAARRAGVGRAGTSTSTARCRSRLMLSGTHPGSACELGITSRGYCWSSPLPEWRDRGGLHDLSPSLRPEPDEGDESRQRRSRTQRPGAPSGPEWVRPLRRRRRATPDARPEPPLSAAGIVRSVYDAPTHPATMRRHITRCPRPEPDERDESRQVRSCR
jgi:hypothetical protein